MDQQILPTKNNRSFIRPMGSWRGRSRDESGPVESFRVTYFQRQVLLIVGDTLLLLISMIGAWWLESQNSEFPASIPMSPQSVYWAIILLGIWFVFGWLSDLYNVRSAHVRWLSAVRIAIVVLLSALVAVLLAFPLGKVFPGAFIIPFLGISLLLVTTWRFAYAALSRTSLFDNRVLILGTGSSARTTADMLEQEQGTHYELLGYVSELPTADAKVCAGLPVWDSATSLLALGEQLQVNTIVVAMDSELTPTRFTELVACQAQGIGVLSVPAMYQRVYEKVPVEYVDSSWLLEAVQLSSSGNRLLCKRILDIVFSIFALPWFLLVFPLIALAIKLNSPGPVLYRQVRTGLGGKPFEILKFRTMVTDAEGDGKARWAEKNDPRVTEVGRFLRKSRLDEIPQFINILRGDMGLIGPRPERPEFVEELVKELPHYYTRLLVRPGLTGWAQVKYDYTASVSDAHTKLQYDAYYVRHWSLWMDIYILFQTVSVVLRAKGT